MTGLSFFLSSNAAPSQVADHHVHGIFQSCPFLEYTVHDGLTRVGSFSSLGIDTR